MIVIVLRDRLLTITTNCLALLCPVDSAVDVVVAAVDVPVLVLVWSLQPTYRVPEIDSCLD